MTQGFYYDNQEHNSSIRVTLHPNQIWDQDKGEWVDLVPYSEDTKDNPLVDDGEDYTYVTNSPNEFNKEFTGPTPYSKYPICSSIIHDDFQVSIVNDYSAFGGDAIGSMWSGMKPMAPYTSEFAKSLGLMSEKTEEYNKEHGDQGNFSKILSALAQVLGKMSESQGRMANFLKRSLVSQGTMFSYYNGTGIDMGQLQMKFTLFSQYVPTTIIKGNLLKPIETVEFHTVDEQLRLILPYVVGEFKKFNLDEMTEGTSIHGSQFLKDTRLKEFSNEFLAWQMPPGNFSCDFHTIDVAQKGTLKLRIGPYMAVENLVIKTCQLNYSKAMVKNPKAQIDSRGNALIDVNAIVPHSCEVTLGLSPITKYSRNALERFVFGKATEVQRRELINKITSKRTESKVIEDEVSATQREDNMPIEYKPIGEPDININSSSKINNSQDLVKIQPKVDKDDYKTKPSEMTPSGYKILGTQHPGFF